MNSRAVKLTISILLVVSMLCCSFSVFAIDQTDYFKSHGYYWCYLIYEFLHSIGIDVTYQGVLEYNDNIQDTIIDWAINYIADEIEADSQPSNFTIAQWIAPWQVEYDYWGNLRYNSTMLEDMEDFAEWLKAEFSLVNDSQVVLNPVNYLGGILLYEPNKWYAANRWGGNEEYIMMEIDLKNPEPFAYEVYWFPYFDSDENLVRTVVLSYANYGGHGYYCWGSNDGINKSIIQGGSFNMGNSYYFGNRLNGNYYVGSLLTGAYYPEYADFRVMSHSDVAALLNRSTITVEGNMKILTETIVLPSDDPSYTPGDGVVIIDGTPKYEPVVISNVTVDNLPAVISPTAIDDPDLEGVYGEVTPFIRTFSGGMDMMRSIVMQLPEEAIACLFALMGAIIIFGFIKIMREH